MSTQQDIYAPGFKSRPPMLNNENYVPWLSRLLRYAKSRPNGKLIHNSILNGPYVRKMIPEPGDYTQLYDFLKYNQKEVDELKAERLAKIQDPLALMANSNNPYNYLQQPMPNPEDITDPTTAMNMALSLMAKAFKLNYLTPTNNNQRISSNPRNRQIAQPRINMGQDRQIQMVGGNDGNQFRQYVGQNAGNPAGNGNQNHIGNGNLMAARAEGNATGQNGNQMRCYNCRGVGHYARNCTVRPRRRDAGYLQTQLLIAQKEEAGIQLQAEEYVPMAAAADLDEIGEVNANCILMANLQQASTSGTQTDSPPVYDTDGSTEVHKNCDDNEIFNMFTQEEQYTQLLKPIPESHQVPQNDNDVISEDTGVEQGKCYLNKEETLQLAQESRDKMKQMNKEIKPANYTKINHLSGVFVPQKALSREELYFLNNSKLANVSKLFLIPNEDLSDDTTPSVARKFLNEVKSTILTFQRVVKQRMTIETHNWASSAHQELHKIVTDENFPIVNQVDARLQNFKIQFLKEADKFVGDFKSLTNEADASLAKNKALELEIERLLKAVVNLHTELERTKERFENCIIKKETEYAKLWNDWYKKCDECKYDKISYDKAYKDMQQKIERLQAQLGDLKGKSKDTSSVSDIRNPLSQKLENKNVELEFQVLNYARENAHLKATYKNMFDTISVSRAQAKTIIASLQNELQSNIYKNAKLRMQLFKKVSDQKDNAQDLSANTKFAKQPIVENIPKIGKTNALSNPVTLNSDSTPQESKRVNNDKVIAPGMFRINPSKNSREESMCLIQLVQMLGQNRSLSHNHMSSLRKR
nr:hypothetical protein [Tanacetum cinerariifolium]